MAEPLPPPPPPPPDVEGLHTDPGTAGQYQLAAPTHFTPDAAGLYTNPGTAGQYQLAAPTHFTPDAEGRYAAPGTARQWQLAAPTHFAPATQDREETAFPEDEAGFSAYYRVPPGDTSPRLSVSEIYDTLLDTPDESNRVRSKAGIGVDLGANFGIVRVRLFASRDVLGANTDVTLYFDDHGWIVAYLPANAPASQIWCHHCADDEPQADSKANAHLDNNLLLLAIDEVLAINAALAANHPDATAAPNAPRAPRDKVGYYHWKHQACNAFLLFGNVAADGQSDPIRFVIPKSIANVQASAAALLTSHPVAGAATTARVTVDETEAATANSENPLAAAQFKLNRDDTKTSLHHMSVAADPGKSAAGIVMLVYTKP